MLPIRHPNVLFQTSGVFNALSFMQFDHKHGLYPSLHAVTAMLGHGDITGTDPGLSTVQLACENVLIDGLA